MRRGIFEPGKSVIKQFLPLVGWCLTVLIFAGLSQAQNPKQAPTPEQRRDAAATKEESDYQNLQRARHLLMLKNDIKGLEDASMRCTARLEIVRFIFGNDVRDEFDSAESMAIDFFEDIANSPVEIPAVSADRFKNQILAVFRQRSPDFAAKVLKKYMPQADTSVADINELDSGTDPGVIASRTAAKIAAGNVSDYVLTIYNQLRDRDPVAANKVLEALLGYFERTQDTSKFSLLLDFLRSNYVAATTPAELKVRYLRFVIERSRRQIGDPDTGPTARFVLRMLKDALPLIQDSIPPLFVEAQAMFVILDNRLNQNQSNRARNDAYARIEASDDRLQQIITEAEAETDVGFRDFLWAWAAKIALERKDLKMAVDLILKVSPTANGFTMDADGISADHDGFLLHDALKAAIRLKDFEFCDYIVGKIQNDGYRSDGLLTLASALSVAGNRDQAFETLTAALKLIEKEDASSDTVRHFLGVVPTALKIDKAAGFETARAAVKMVNRLPTPSAEDKVGTPARGKYVLLTLQMISMSAAPTFKVLAQNNIGLTDSVVDEIKLKPVKLMAEIVVEAERKYPMPPKTKLTRSGATQQ